MHDEDQHDLRDILLALVLAPAMVMGAAWLSSLAPHDCFDMNGSPCAVEVRD